jgi:hypothetical protein
MSTADTTRVHLFEGERTRHRDNAHRALVLAKENLDRLLAGWDTESPGLIEMHARHLVGQTTEAHAEAAAFHSLSDVSFLTSEEQTP